MLVVPCCWCCVVGTVLLVLCCSYRVAGTNTEREVNNCKPKCLSPGVFRPIEQASVPRQLSY